MTPTKAIAVAAVLAGVLASTNAGAGQAAETAVLKMKPLEGVSFDVGADRAVSYFLADKGQCKLVVTRAQEPNWDEGGTFVATRFEAAIAAGKATRYVPGSGKTFEFACLDGAHAMTVKTVDLVAAGGTE